MWRMQYQYIEINTKSGVMDKEVAREWDWGKVSQLATLLDMSGMHARIPVCISDK